MSDPRPRTAEPRSFFPREIPLVALASVVLALVMNLPLTATLTSHMPEVGNGDPYLQAWQVAWQGHALANQPYDYFDGNIFWPERNSLAFSDALIGYAPTGLIGNGLKAAHIRYNLLFLFAYVLAFFGAYLLAREMGARSPPACAVAAAAYAYAPFRLSQNNHLHIISSGGLVLALFLLLRGYRRQRPRMIVGGWVVAAWQVSIGFSVGLHLAYIMGILGLTWGAQWLRGGRPSIPKQTIVASAIGATLFSSWCAIQVRPYFEVVELHPYAKRQVASLEKYSPPPSGYLSAPRQSLLWGSATASARDGLAQPDEQSVFLGFSVLMLAGAGLGAAEIYSRMRRRALALASISVGIMSLGFGWVGGSLVYGALFRLPGWNAIRTPGRLTAITALCLGLLAAAGTERLMARTSSWRPRRAASVLGWAVAAIVLVEGAGHIEVTRPAPAPMGRLGLATPQVHLPFDSISDRTHTYWSIDEFPKIANGMSGFFPHEQGRLKATMTQFPNAASVAALQGLGIRTVIFHPDLAVATKFEEVGKRSVEGLPLTVERREDVLVFHLQR